MKASAITLCFAASMLCASSVHAAPKCFPVAGSQQERVIPGNPCNSPVGFCLEGSFSGPLRGTLDINATSLQPTPDAAVTGGIFTTADITFQGRVLGRQGTLIFKEAASLQGSGRANAATLYNIVGASGGLSGTTGTLRLSGIFDFDTGEANARYEGEVCLR